GDQRRIGADVEVQGEPARACLHAEEAVDGRSVDQLLRHPARRLVRTGAGERLPERGSADLAADHHALAAIVVRLLPHVTRAVPKGSIIDVVEQPGPGNELRDSRSLFAAE